MSSKRKLIHEYWKRCWPRGPSNGDGDADERGRWTMSQREQEKQAQKTNITRGNRMGLSGRKNTASSFWSNTFNSADEETRSQGTKWLTSKPSGRIASITAWKFQDWRRRKTVRQEGQMREERGRNGQKKLKYKERKMMGGEEEWDQAGR